MVLIRHAVRVSGITGLALTKLDVLTGLDKLRICVGYRTEKGEELTDNLPSNMDALEKCRPVYEEMEGWTEDINQARRIEELPKNTRRYIERIETLADIKSVLVSVGAGRNETIILKNPFSS
jgi:adenylosuccinate synthase